MSTMKAARINGYGGLEELVYMDTPKPEPGEGKMLVRVAAASINPVDNAMRMGYMAGYINPTFPLTLGMDYAGIVEELGPGANTFKPGDAVYGRSDFGFDGTYAEYVVVQSDDSVAKPADLDFIHAAALPHVALTAWVGLVKTANLSAGQKVLIHAAAGGVGHVAVQLAKARGAIVYGTASARNQDFLRQIGVDVPIDYTTTNFVDVAKEMDVVFDSVGGETQDRCWQTLKPGGMLLSVVQAPSQEAASKFGCQGIMVGAMPPVAPALKEISALVEAGKIKPEVSAILPLSDARKAQEMVQGGHTRGKVVLKVAD